MKIDNGLFNHMVLQRASDNRSAAPFNGTCPASGPVKASISRDGKTVRGFANKTVGTAADNRFSGQIDGLPVGGPYDITLKIGSHSLTIADVLVGDLWILAGQSNMQGYGIIPPGLPAIPQVRAFYMDDHWDIARDPIHNIWEAVDQVHADLNGGNLPAKPEANLGVCPGPSFGAEMFDLSNGVPQGLISCAHGGTSMAQWSQALKRQGGKSLYGATLRRIKKNGGRVAGMIWYQGCSDTNATAAPLYTSRMKKLIAALRRDCHNPTLPVVIVQIARSIGLYDNRGLESWNSVQDQQRLLPRHIKHLTTVPAVDLTLDDSIHISGTSHITLGIRLAQAMQALRGDPKAGPLPITLKSISIANNRGWGVAIVEFDNVSGSLVAGSRPTGFHISFQNGANHIFDIRLEANRAHIYTNLHLSDLQGTVIHYGYGNDPICNITDEANRSLPVFGPVTIGDPRAVTLFQRSWHISTFQPSAGDLTSLDYPANLASIPFVERTFDSSFCSLHPEIEEHGRRDSVIFYRARFECQTAMQLALAVGYDGPVKVWIDGRQLFHDPAGCNPAMQDRGIANFKASAGSHEVLIALGTNNGAAWGIYFRLERLGLSPRTLRSKNYLLPTFTL